MQGEILADIREHHVITASTHMRADGGARGELIAIIHTLDTDDRGAFFTVPIILVRRLFSEDQVQTLDPRDVTGMNGEEDHILGRLGRAGRPKRLFLEFQKGLFRREVIFFGRQDRRDINKRHILQLIDGTEDESALFLLGSINLAFAFKGIEPTAQIFLVDNGMCHKDVLVFTTSRGPTALPGPWGRAQSQALYPAMRRRFLFRREASGPLRNACENALPPSRQTRKGQRLPCGPAGLRVPAAVEPRRPACYG